MHIPMCMVYVEMQPNLILDYFDKHESTTLVISICSAWIVVYQQMLVPSLAVTKNSISTISVYIYTLRTI
jgi:hypothetical protein